MERTKVNLSRKQQKVRSDKYFSQFKMGFTFPEARTQKEIELESLAREFIVHKISAAGVSYIISSPSPIRRTLWFIGVTCCVAFMGYMTLNVILEYLRYPKMLIKEDVITAKLPFPAVTLCSLNPISNRYVSETSLQKLQKLSNMLKNITSSKTNQTFRNHCTQNLLCKWSWFQETCFCTTNPCLTEFCLLDNSNHCTCSFAFCKRDKLMSCRINSNYSEDICECENSDSNIWTKVSTEFCTNVQKILDLIQDKEVRSVVRLVINAQTNDLVDVEEALLPSTSELQNYGGTFDSLVSSCSFEGAICYRENFTVLYHPNYGKCYMFNYVGIGKESPIDTYTYGSKSGLQLLLRVTDENALPLLSREIGARVVIHDPHSLPFVSEYGVNVRPRDMTTVEMSMTKTNRLGYPWGNCEEISLNQEEEPYSVLGCEKTCALLYMTKMCNCTMRHLLRETVVSRNNIQYPLCNISNRREKMCVKQVTLDLEKTSTHCNCKQPCSETKYSYTVASSELNEEFYRTAKAIRTLRIDPNGKLKYIEATDQKSMVGVKVYYNTFQVTMYKEVKSYSWETLIANIGGNLGFFMGLTLVTFFEVFEFLWDFILTAFRRPKNNKVHFLPHTRRRKNFCVCSNNSTRNWILRRRKSV